MRRSRMRELSMEVLVGTFMFVALLGLCIFTIVLSRENVFRQSYPLEVVFDDVMGLRDGDNVTLRGMAVGKVKSLALGPDGVVVRASLRLQPRLTADSSAEVVMASVLGGRALQIDEGAPSKEPVAPGTTLRGRPPKDAMALIADIAVDLKDITGKINAGEGTLGKLVNDDTLYVDLREAVARVKAALGEGGLVRNAEEAMANLNEITAKVNGGEGTLGLLVNDESLYLEVRQVVGDIRAALHDMRETAPIATFSSIFFGAF